LRYFCKSGPWVSGWRPRTGAWKI